MKKLRALVRRASSRSQRELLTAAVGTPTGVVTEGYLYILHASKTVANAAKGSSWKKRYFVLHADGQLNYFKSGKAGVGKDAKGGALLNGDYFVGDSLLRRNGFQVRQSSARPATPSLRKSLHFGAASLDVAHRLPHLPHPACRHAFFR